ncbi:MAG TPA: hypothetical protein VKY74_14180 [Chloroflexia bacterium]|nr:hypothetical protein [Chloroflexia bacterium]
MKLDIGTPVRYPDGEQAGIISKVVFDPESATVHEIVLETPDLVGRKVLVSIALLREDPGEVLTLVADREGLDALPDYTVERFAAAPDGWTAPAEYMPHDILFPTSVTYPIMPVFEESNAPAGSIEWSQGTEAICTDGRFGVVDEVITDDVGHITGVVLRGDADPQPRLLITPDLIVESDSQVLQLSCTLDELPSRAEPFSDPEGEPEPDSLLPTN